MRSHATLIRAFTEHAERAPDREALSDGDGRRWTYGRLHAAVAAVGRALVRHGVRPGSRVAVVGGRTADTVVALLGVLHAGGAYCVVDPTLPRGREEVVLADLDPRAFVVATDGWHGEGGPDVVRLDRVVPVVGAEHEPVFHALADDLAYVMYTSGSTGRPKGVLVEHRSVLNMLDSYDLLAPPGDGPVGALVAPPGFDVSVWDVFSVLTRGGTLRVLGEADLRDGGSLWRALVDNGVTSAYVPPGLLASVVDAAERDRSGRAVLDRVLVGVEPIPQGLLDRFRHAVPGLRVVNGYGPTETTITATLHLLGAVADPTRRTPIGHPVLGSSVALLDDRLEPVADGEPGEVVVFGDCLARGYHGADGGGFVTLADGRAYRTGDYARRLPDGALEFIGRRDGQVKVNGFRVETGEVEAALVTAPGVRRAVVLVAGEAGAHRLVAAVEGGADVHPDVLRDHLAERLPAHAVPSRVLVVREFPLSANGKVDAAALLALDRGRPADAPRSAPAGTDREKRAVAVWAAVLGVDEVGVDDDFHQLGGNSLDAVRIAARLTGQGQPTSAADVLETRTVRLLCAAETTAVPVATPASPGAHPASRAHQGLWAWRELTPADASSTVVHAVRLDGDVDPDRVRRAVASVAARHEALRTTFHPTADGGVEQRVAVPGPVDVPVVDVASESDVDGRLVELVNRRFDVSTRPWVAELLVARGFAALVVAADHLVFDGESAVVFERDLARAYETGDAGPPVPGPASEGTRTAPSAERAALLREHWSRVLDGLEDVPALPPPLERVPRETGRYRLVREVPAPVWDAVVALARRERTTPFSVLLAAFKAFQRRRRGTGDDVVTIALSRRHAVGCADALGHFVNLLPVRDRVPRDGDGLSFRSYVGAVANLVRESVAHGDLPFEDMVALLPRTPGATVASPARTVLVQRVTGPELDAGIRLGSWPAIPSNSLHDLAVFVDEGRGCRPTRLEWVWDAAKAMPGSAEWSAEAFDAFLAAVALRPDVPPDDAPVLAPGEEALVRANLGPAEAPDTTLVDLVDRQVREHPDSVAVQDGDLLLTYSALDRRAEEIAALLPGDGRPVAVVLDKSADLVATLVAVLRVGSCYLPLAPDHAATRLADLARRAGATACVTRSGLLDAVPEGVRVVLADQAHAAPPAARRDRPVAPADLAYVMPTSGTTGEPKLVGVPHRAVVRLVHGSESLPLGGDDRTLLVSNSSFDAATFEVWGALVNGGRVVVPEPGELRDPALLCRALERHGITAGFFTVTLFERLVEAEPRRLAGMRHVVVGGEAVPPRLFADAARHLPAGVLVNGYGPTENTTFSTCYRLDRDPSDLRSVPIGRPITGSGAVVVDAALRPVPVGAVGEVLVCGPGLAHGYLDDPATTAQRFVRLDVLGGRTAYRTGDLGRLLPDGNLECLGRVDRQLKVRGFRVEPGEVEAALEAHPAVRRAIAYGRRAGGALSLRAAVEATGVGARALRAWLATRVPGYLVPDVVHVVGAFPMTPNGKLDHAALDAAAAPAAGGTSAPRTDAERDLARIWADLLGVAELGVDDDVFALGANSMTVLAASARLRREAGLVLPTHTLYTVRTVRGQAAHGAKSAAPEADLRHRAGRRAALRRKTPGPVPRER